MLKIIMLLGIASILTYISKYNLELVSVNVGKYVVSDIPLFYVIVGSILLGMVMSYVIQLANNILTYFVIRRKSNEIKVGKSEILNLTKTVHQLELDNEKLKHGGMIDDDPRAL